MIALALVLLCPPAAAPALQEEGATPVTLEDHPRDFEGTQPGGAFPRWSVGFGVDVWSGFGEVFNDVVGPSLTATHRFDGRWGVALSVFRSDFDFEDPAENVFDQQGTPVIDASIDLFMVSATARWYFTDPGASFDFYVGAGLGLAVPSSGEAVSLPQVDIAVDGNAGPEVHVAAGGSVRLFGQLHFLSELRLMQSFTSYDVENRLTGETESESGWAGYGIRFGLEWRF